MMNWKRQHTLIAGISLIVATNAIALAEVVYNRSGLPESTLKLSERELQLPYRGGMNNDNSGISLRLLTRNLVDLNSLPIEYVDYGGNSAWLDKAKMATLGFNVSVSIDKEQGQQHYEKQSSKQVFLVVEFDGKSYQRALEHAKQLEITESTRTEHTTFEAEKSLRSRLFTVDAGLQREELRKKYPDTTHFIIIRGQVRPLIGITPDRKKRLTGYVSSDFESINVPPEYRHVFEPMLRGVETITYNPFQNKQPPFEVTLAFGKHLEPWIVSASEKKE